jgi:hypothetical protein
MLKCIEDLMSIVFPVQIKISHRKQKNKGL